VPSQSTPAAITTPPNVISGPNTGSGPDGSGSGDALWVTALVAIVVGSLVLGLSVRAHHRRPR
jgi:hypothetical protein